MRVCVRASARMLTPPHPLSQDNQPQQTGTYWNTPRYQFRRQDYGELQTAEARKNPETWQPMRIKSCEPGGLISVV